MSASETMRAVEAMFDNYERMMSKVRVARASGKYSSGVTRVTTDERLVARKMHALGYTCVEIAEHLGRGETAVQNMVKAKTR